MCVSGQLNVRKDDDINEDKIQNNSVKCTLVCAGYCDCNNIVYTNSIFAFDNRYAWNRELGLPEIYIRKSRRGEFVNITSLTKRELREWHNLARLYIGGEFSEEKD